MGRRKAYGREEVLARGLDAFWTGGYHATSARQLAAASGVNVSTLYSEFESKEGFYSAALDRYEREVVSAFFGPLEAPDASLATVRATLRQFPAMVKQVAAPPGCLVTNAAVEQAPSAAASHAAMARYVRRVADGIQHAILNTATDSRMDGLAVRQLAHQLVATLIGFFVMARAQVSLEVLDDAVESAVRQVDAFAAQHGIGNSDNES